MNTRFDSGVDNGSRIILAWIVCSPVALDERNHVNTSRRPPLGPLDPTRATFCLAPFEPEYYCGPSVRVPAEPMAKES